MVNNVERNVETQSPITIAYDRFVNFFHSVYERPMEFSNPFPSRVRKDFEDGLYLEITSFDKKNDRDSFKVELKDSYTHLNRSISFSFDFDENGIDSMTRGNGWFCFLSYPGRGKTPEEIKFAELLVPLTQWTMKCFQEGRYKPLQESLPKETFAQINGYKMVDMSPLRHLAFRP